MCGRFTIGLKFTFEALSADKKMRIAATLPPPILYPPCHAVFRGRLSTVGLGGWKLEHIVIHGFQINWVDIFNGLGPIQ